MTTLLGWLMMVAVLSLVRIEGPELDIPSPDKLVHTILYAITALLMYVVLKEKGLVRKKGLQAAVAIAVVGATAFGVLMEMAQGFTPYRTPSFWDAVFNAAGALLAGAFLMYKERPIRSQAR